ncbi:MAG: prephenate dehydratase [Chloroflexi bacterium]|jgi:prephenate dehydratase|nr:prephenate dehydratase [Chloroflexota bacterium]MBT5627434.1 prephenate dehydratase [Chloroflexota bacterium]
MPKTVAFLGPEGTYTDEACFFYAPDEERIPFASLGLVTSALEEGKVDQAVVPIENSLGGAVIETVDYLITSKNSHIVGEILLPIDHCLITRPGVQLGDIRVVMSKQEALTQCREFLSTELRFAEQIPTTSTASAVTDLKEADDRVAAIGPRRSAELAGLPILAQGIQDRQNNVTRFAVLSSNGDYPADSDKTSIAFDFDRPDAPGLVYGALSPFADRDINLLKIESRPTGKGMGNYIFLLDFEGKIDEPHVQEAIELLKKNTATFKVFGTYPRAKGLAIR